MASSFSSQPHGEDKASVVDDNNNNKDSSSSPSHADANVSTGNDPSTTQPQENREDRATILTNYPQLFGATAVGTGDDWETAIRIFGRQPFSGEPHSAADNNNTKDPSSSQSHGDANVKMINDPSALQPHDSSSVYADYSMEDKASYLNNYPRIFEAAAVAARDNWETDIRTFGRQPFSKEPRSIFYNNNDANVNMGNDPSTSRSHYNSGVYINRANDPFTFQAQDNSSFYTDYSMEDEVDNYSDLLEEAAAEIADALADELAGRDDLETAIRTIKRQTLLGESRNIADNNNKDPSSSQSHANANVNMGNDPSTSRPHDNSSVPAGNETKDLNYYLPLYKAALKGDWETARMFFEGDPDAVNARINDRSKNALHLAVGTRRSNNFVKNLVELMTASDLALQDDNRETALSIAATVGNLEAAKLMVEKNPDLPNIRDRESAVPLHRAVQYYHKDMVLYLLQVTRDDIQPSPFAGESGVTILILLVGVGFYDVAVDLLERYPNMARSNVFGGKTPLGVLAVKPCDFPSGCGFNSWQRLVYKCVPPSLDEFFKNKNGADTENPAESSEEHMWICSSLRKHMSYAWQKMHLTLWDVVEKIVPYVKNIRDTKVMHDQVLQIVRRLCEEAAKLDFSQAISLLEMPLLMAARYGNPEVVEEIAEQLPPVLWTVDAQKRDIFKVAVLNRREKVFNLLYQMSDHKRYLIQGEDIWRNNILHLAGQLAPRNQLNLVSSAALQMQRELQWYKEVEKFLYPAYRDVTNGEGKTPSMVFTEAHKDLVIEGEKWMKDTANSCSVVAALIATVVFAAAITVPGGNGDSGYPIFTVEKAFIIFAVSDALSLFSSTAAILTFLSILTARYAEEDFLYALPKRLIMGLLTLFISITSMMTAFSSALYLVFGENQTGILISIAGAACLLVALFVYLQFPLLLVMINSTYGTGIFGKQSERPLF